ncbi:hypothetical protein pb186bvf_010472 [Paramecium bursaria]
MFCLNLYIWIIKFQLQLMYLVATQYSSSRVLEAIIYQTQLDF